MVGWVVLTWWGSFKYINGTCAPRVDERKNNRVRDEVMEMEAMRISPLPPMSPEDEADLFNQFCWWDDSPPKREHPPPPSPSCQLY